MGKDKEIRVLEQRIYTKHPYYEMLCEKMSKSRELYNALNYVARNYYIRECKLYNDSNADVSNILVNSIVEELIQESLDKGQKKKRPLYLDMYILKKVMRRDACINEIYRKSGLGSNCADNVVEQVCDAWKGYIASLTKYNKDNSKFKGKPKLPNYLVKGSLNKLEFDVVNLKFKEGVISLPDYYAGFIVKTGLEKVKVLRCIFKTTYISVEIVYEIEAKSFITDNGKYIAIDIGVDNLAAITNNCNKPFILINGKPLKSINQYYNKEKSHYQEIAKRMNNKNSTKRLERLIEKRNNKIKDYMHKASRYVVELAEDYNVSKIIIGKNDFWKQEVDIGERNNQNFISIPHAIFINMIKYKAKEKGIEVIEVEESYTSGTSFLDGEQPVKKNYNKNRRVKRGLFKSNDGLFINSDINGSLQIMKKFKNNVWSNVDISKLLIHPKLITIEK